MAVLIEILGGERAFGRALCSELALHWVLLDGLPSACLSALEARLGPDAIAEVRVVVGRAAGAGGEAEVPERLSRRAGDRLYAVARGLASATLRLGSLDAAERFLLARVPELGGSTRFDLLTSAPGARLVDDLIDGLDPGAPR